MSHHRVPVGHLQWPLTMLPPPTLVLLQCAPCTAAGGIHSNLTQMVSLDMTPLHGSVTFPAQGHLLHVTSGLCTPCCQLSSPDSLFYSHPSLLPGAQECLYTLGPQGLCTGSHLFPRVPLASSLPSSSLCLNVTFSGTPPSPPQLHPSKSSGTFLLAYFLLSTAHSNHPPQVIQVIMYPDHCSWPEPTRMLIPDAVTFAVLGFTDVSHLDQDGAHVVFLFF